MVPAPITATLAILRCGGLQAHGDLAGGAFAEEGMAQGLHSGVITGR
jgi:hypothetical protein